MLFQAMVIFLPISIFFKILSERGKSISKAELSRVYFNILYFFAGLVAGSIEAKVWMVVNSRRVFENLNRMTLLNLKRAKHRQINNLSS